MSFIDDIIQYPDEESISTVEYYWTTKDGNNIPVWELENSHIVNILRKFPEAESVRAWAEYKGISKQPNQPQKEDGV